MKQYPFELGERVEYSMKPAPDWGAEITEVWQVDDVFFRIKFPAIIGGRYSSQVVIEEVVPVDVVKLEWRVK